MEAAGSTVNVLSSLYRVPHGQHAVLVDLVLEVLVMVKSTAAALLCSFGTVFVMPQASGSSANTSPPHRQQLDQSAFPRPTIHGYNTHNQSSEHSKVRACGASSFLSCSLCVLVIRRLVEKTLPPYHAAVNDASLCYPTLVDPAPPHGPTSIRCAAATSSNAEQML